MGEASPEFRACLRYWRYNLADVERSGESAKPADAAPHSPATSFYTDSASLWKGQVDADTVQSLYDGERERRDSDNLPGPIPVVVHPFLLARARQGDQRASTPGLSPLILPALLYDDGRLKAAGGHVLIPRAMLRPRETLDSPQLGHLDAYNDFYAQAEPPGKAEAWSRVRDFVHRLWQAVTGDDFGDGAALQQISGLTLLDKGSVALDPGMGPTRLGQIYDDLQECADPAQAAPLLADLCRLETSRPATTDELPAQIRHLGQMRGDSPLSASQRRGLLALQGRGASRLLAVNSPPGTGKRNFLQAVVATEMVRTASEGAEPPLILVASHNNQTVTNLLDALEWSGPLPAEHPYADSPLTRRWLPQLSSFGLYLAPQSLEREAARSAHPFSYELRFMRGSVRWWESREAVEEAAEALLSGYEDWQGRRPDADSLLAQLRRVQTDLRNSLNRILHNLQEVYDAWGELEKVRLKQGNAATEELGTWRHELVSRLAGAEGRLDRMESELEEGGGSEQAQKQADKQRGVTEEMRQLLQMLDRELSSRRRAEERWRSAVVKLARAAPEKAENPEWDQVDGRGLERELDQNLRYPAFLLAARYWEADWAITLLAEHEAGTDLSGRGQADVRDRLRRLARVTPCLVGTFHSLPRQFGYSEQDRRRPLFGEADLLVVDDADQVTPEMGASGFALARRGLVLGDRQQVPPVRDLPRGVDYRNLIRAGLTEQEPVLEEQGRRAWSGDLLRVAQHRTAYSSDKGAEPGIFLAEHWRCLDPIIAIPNRIAYGNRLIPRRGSQGRAPVPPLAYGHIHTHQLRRIGSSPCNPSEARVVARWVVENRERLVAAYPEAEGNLARILAIATPFQAQARTIRSALRELKVAEAGPRGGGLTIGTVHALQGADVPIVLFSSTYHGTYSGTPYFDQGPHILNTALTHASDAFLLFGDMRLFDPDSQRPSGYLARELIHGEASGALTDLNYLPLFPVQEQEEAASVLVQLANLEDHRRALAEFFAEAADRVLILTPAVSQAALEADRIPEQVARARQRGVAVTVVVSRQEHDTAEHSAESAPALRGLRQAGAEVRLLPRVFSNIVARDDRELLQGSFAWLSDPRDQDSPFRRTARSARFSGRQAAEMIAALHNSVQGGEPLG